MRYQGGGILVLYWGKRGGGSELTSQIKDSLVGQSVKFFTSTREKTTNSDFPAPSSIWEMRKWLQLRRDVVKFCKLHNINAVVFPMASPWDIFLGRRLRSTPSKTIRIVHDARPHLGEFWPTKFWIRWLCKDADRVIFLSAFVAKKLHTYLNLRDQTYLVTQLPIPTLHSHLLEGSAHALINEPLKKRVLFIGRGKKYKGQALLESAWKLLANQDFSLTILGEGHKIDHESEINYIPDWVDTDTFAQQILLSDLVIFPYVEASQSGIIPICHALGRAVLVTDVGGLAEQIEIGVNGFICKSLTPKDLATSIIDAVDALSNITIRPKKSNIDNFVLQILDPEI
jgi:glycosyltransferase involved in cell wall biosynthesis